MNIKPGWQDKFISSLARSGNVTIAAKSAGISRRNAYNERETDPDFEARWKDSLAQAADLLEEEARRRAVTGTLKPIFYKGDKCATVREYSDTLLVLLLKAAKPEKYRDRSDITSNGETLKAYGLVDPDDL